MATLAQYKAEIEADPSRYVVGAHRYTLKYRPADTFTLPRIPWRVVERGVGYERRTDLPLSAHRFGVVEFDRALTADEVERWELAKV